MGAIAYSNHHTLYFLNYEEDLQNNLFLVPTCHNKSNQPELVFVVHRRHKQLCAYGAILPGDHQIDTWLGWRKDTWSRYQHLLKKIPWCHFMLLCQVISSASNRSGLENPGLTIAIEILFQSLQRRIFHSVLFENFILQFFLIWVNKIYQANCV